jgi:hypothetical protein
VKILLDECVDQRLAEDITGHEVSTVKHGLEFEAERRISNSGRKPIRGFCYYRSQLVVSTQLEALQYCCNRLDRTNKPIE